MNVETEVITYVLTLAVQPLEKPNTNGPLPADRKLAHEKYNREATARAGVLCSASLVSKQWRVAIQSAQWCLALRMLRPYEPGYRQQNRAASFTRARVWCDVRKCQLQHSIRAFILDARTVYHTPSTGRRYPVKQIGVKKMITLGLDKLRGEKKRQFEPLAREYRRVKNNASKMLALLKDEWKT